METAATLEVSGVDARPSGGLCGIFERTATHWRARSLHRLERRSAAPKYPLYRAANWELLGKTTGRGKQSNSYVPNRSIKEVLGYALTKRFRELLGDVG